MSSECFFEFDKPNGVYNSGDTLNGTIVLRTSKDKVISGISVTITGFAKVRWTRLFRTKERIGRKGSTIDTNVLFSADENYFNSKTYVIGAEKADAIDLFAGEHKYPFTQSLSEDLPTSCEEKYGQIRYEVTFNIDRPYRYDNVFKQAFTVIKPFNLNMERKYKLPQKTLDTCTTNCCWCCCFDSNDVTIRAFMRIPIMGYVPGQKIPILLRIDNESEEDVRSGVIKLIKRIKFECVDPEASEENDEYEIVSETFPKVLRLTKKEFRIFLQIPSVAPSSPTTSSHCIQFDYILTVKSSTSLCKVPLFMELPITIGTVPVYGDAINEPNIIFQQPTAPLLEPTKSSAYSPPTYDKMVPPEYEDGVKHCEEFKDKDIDTNHKEMSFVPKYPVYYNVMTPPTAPPSDEAGPSATDEVGGGPGTKNESGWTE